VTALLGMRIVTLAQGDRTTEAWFSVTLLVLWLLAAVAQLVLLVRERSTTAPQ